MQTFYLHENKEGFSMEFNPQFAAYQKEYLRSIEDPKTFWSEIAQEFDWKSRWDQVLSWDFDAARVAWFKGAQLNLSYNALDRHLPEKANQTAILWESNDPNIPSRKLSYAELHEMVGRMGNVLLELGIRKGDTVAIYMPMVPEAAAALLACSRIGAVHSVVFAGFSAQALSDRMNDAQCKLLLTADGFYRGEKWVPLKDIAQQSLQQNESVHKVLCLRTGLVPQELPDDRWLDWDTMVQSASPILEPVWVEAEDPLFILYTSGSTGKPKGLLHTTAGYMVYAGYTFKKVFDYREGEIFFCTADIGWITGHTYLIYGPLLNGGTTLMFEGVPTWPAPDRFWKIVEKHQVNIFYTAPTAIRSLEAFGTDLIAQCDLTSLRVLGSVGEPINEEAWEWYHHHIGGERCPIADTWWQTETGGVLITSCAGTVPALPAWAGLPMPGIQPALLNEKGEELTHAEAEGNLVIRFPWPGMARTIFGDHERFRQTYFSTYPGFYFTGDGAKRNANGYYRITGRVDDVINVSGHRIGTGELEAAIDEHSSITESAVVGFPHPVKGQGIYAYVVGPTGLTDTPQLEEEIKQLVGKLIGPFARPDLVQVVPALPKTRSGKIMRRILRKIAEGALDQLGDTSTLLDPGVVDWISNHRKSI